MNRMFESPLTTKLFPMFVDSLSIVRYTKCWISGIGNLRIRGTSTAYINPATHCRTPNIRHTQPFTSMAECHDLLPSPCVRGMTVLEREKFRKMVNLPKLIVPEVSFKSVLPHIKRLLLKIQRHKSVEPSIDGTKKILLNPSAVTCFGDLPDEIKNLGLNGSHLIWEDFEMNYDNWNAEEILKAVLPVEHEACTSFSRIGHIIHVNLKSHLVPYKRLIGEVFRDKIHGTRCVINKIQTIENTYRNFTLELLCGEEDYLVEVKENGVAFELDFAHVYWNPRLSTEHERIIKMHERGDVLYDVFAGVGPFSVPVAKRKAYVLANDLNPASFKWLQHNVKKNKVMDYMQTFNKDGRDFIMTDVKDDLIKRWNSKIVKNFNIHLTMNLPAMAVEFLDAFCGLMVGYSGPTAPWPLVHVYCFAKGDDPAQIARAMVEEHIGTKLSTNLQGVNFVRNVAPNKDMFRVSFFLTRQILFGKKAACKRAITADELPTTEANHKKPCNWVGARHLTFRRANQLEISKRENRNKTFFLWNSKNKKSEKIQKIHEIGAKRTIFSFQFFWHFLHGHRKISFYGHRLTWYFRHFQRQSKERETEHGKEEGIHERQYERR